MKVCKNCFTEMSESSVKCPTCGGTDLSFKCDACGTIYDNSQVCPNCGAARLPEENNSENKIPVWFWIVSAILCFPIAVTCWCVNNSKLNKTWVKVAIISVVWLVYCEIGGLIGALFRLIF